MRNHESIASQKIETPKQAAIRLITNHKDKPIEKGFKLINLHEYHDKNGISSHWKIRMKHPETGNKWMRFMHRDKQKYILSAPLFPNGAPLYRQPKLLENAHEVVWFYEGENCVETMEKLGFTATTTGSCTTVDGIDYSTLAKRRINLWPDADEAGFKYAIAITKKLKAIGCTVQWIDVEKLNLSESDDCIDWLSKHPNASQQDIQNLPKINPPLEQDIPKNEHHAKSPIGYPRFEIKSDGIYYCKDEKASLWLCSKIDVKALTRDSNSNNWGRVLEFKDADGINHNWPMPMELLGGNGDELCKELLRSGLRIAAGASTRKLLVEYITNAETETRARCVLQTGWHSGCFVLPDKVYGNLVNETMLLQTDNIVNNHYSTLGSLSDWQHHILPLSIGNSRLIFGMSLSFAVPLLGKLNLESGGFHLRGDSSIGKSTILQGAASIYGGKFYVQNLRATDNALEGLAAQHNHTLFILDELSQLNPKIAGEVFYMLANGQSKARAFKYGTARGRLTWELLFLTSSELSLATHMQEVGQKIRAGQEVRLIDIPADAGQGHGIFENLHGYQSGAELSNALKDLCQRYHGTAIDEFLKKLVMDDFQIITGLLKRAEEKFLQLIPNNSHGQVKRVAQRFALVAAGGELSILYGITRLETSGWQEGDAIDAAIICFLAWLGSREALTSGHEEERSLTQLRHFFQAHESRFAHFDDWNDEKRQIHNRAGFKKDGEYFCFVETFRKEICSGLDYKKIEHLCAEKGWLLRDSQGNFTQNTRVPGYKKQQRLYRFSCLVMGEKEVDEE